jgi:hypothetical protein
MVISMVLYIGVLLTHRTVSYIEQGAAPSVNQTLIHNKGAYYKIEYSTTQGITSEICIYQASHLEPLMFRENVRRYL